ncbi:MAG: DUF393 domain-containing protein [Saprospiraceae bacterium]
MVNNDLICNTLIKHQPILIYDGECMLCHYLVQWVVKWDKHQLIKLAHIQTLNEQKNTLVSTDTVTLIANGQIYTKSKAVSHVMALLGFPFNIGAIIMKVIPTYLMDVVYDFIAKNRLYFSGNVKKCPTMDPKLMQRIVQVDLLIME